MIVYKCKDSLEGVFTAIYKAYEDHCTPADTRITTVEESLLFAEIREVEADPVRAEKVSRTLRSKFGEENYYDLCLALSSYDEEKANAVYQTVALGLSGKIRPGHLLDNLANDFVNKTFKISKNAGREQHHFLGFLRFEELEDGILYGHITAKNHILTFLMPHFADRLPGENFVVYDAGHKVFGVHPKFQDWYMVSGAELGEEMEERLFSTEEENYQNLFRHFCKSITIEARENPALQRNMLPLRFRKDMVEFR